MIADFEAGNLDFIDNVPYTVANTLKGHSGVTLDESPGSEVTNLGFNSNPEEAQEPRAARTRSSSEAFEYAIPRKQIIDVVFGGHAQPWANLMSAFSVPSGWVNPAVKPLPYNPAKAKAILDGLGYKAGSGGVRQVPATTGKYAQAAHAMSYKVIVPNDLDFNGDRQFADPRRGLREDRRAAARGRGRRRRPGVHRDHGAQGHVPEGRHVHLVLAPLRRPELQPLGRDQGAVEQQQRHGLRRPEVRRLVRRSRRRSSTSKKRQALVWKMEAYLAQKRPYIQLVDTSLLTANSSRWTGFYAESLVVLQVLLHEPASELTPRSRLAGCGPSREEGRLRHQAHGLRARDDPRRGHAQLLPLPRRPGRRGRRACAASRARRSSRPRSVISTASTSRSSSSTSSTSTDSRTATSARRCTTTSPSGTTSSRRS